MKKFLVIIALILGITIQSQSNVALADIDIEGRKSWTTDGRPPEAFGVKASHKSKKKFVIIEVNGNTSIEDLEKVLKKLDIDAEG